MKRLKAIEGSPISQVVQPGRANFAMIEKVALHNLDQLMQEDMQAARLVMSLIRLMEPGSGGIVVASNKSLQELLGVSESTVARALRTLVKGQWVQRIRVAGAHALAINKAVAWVGPRGQMEHAVFFATVVASRTEQDAAGINPGELRQLPMALPGEDVLPIGEAEPPAQELIPGTEQVARMADPDTGEIIDHYESERQRLGLPKGAEIPNPFREMTPEQIEQIRAKAFQAGLEARGQGRLEI